MTLAATTASTTFWVVVASSLSLLSVSAALAKTTSPETPVVAKHAEHPKAAVHLTAQNDPPAPVRWVVLGAAKSMAIKYANALTSKR